MKSLSSALTTILGYMLLATLSACGDTEDGIIEIENPAVAVSSPSWSPMHAVDASGRSEQIYWEYKINGGQNLDLSFDGNNLSLQTGNLKILVDPANLTRTTSLVAGLDFIVDNENFSGTASLNSIERLDPSRYPESALIKSQKTTFTAAGTQDFYALSLIFATDITFTPGTEWFPDREDLNLLDTGYIYSEQGAVSWDGNYSLEIDTNFPLDLPPAHKSINGSSPEHWEVADKIDALTVGGKSYTDVIKLIRTIQTPDLGKGDATNVGISYWVAKGIGVIKSEGDFTLFGSTFSMELVDSNLI